MIIDIVAGVGWTIAILALLFTARCYQELRSWARQCNGARIIVAYNNRVKLQAPLTEWMLWTRKLDEDERAAGRVVFREHKMSVAIAGRPEDPPKQRLYTRARETYKAVKGARASRGFSGAPVK